MGGDLRKVVSLHPGAEYEMVNNLSQLFVVKLPKLCLCVNVLNVQNLYLH